MILTNTKQKYFVSVISNLLGMFLFASTLRFDIARNIVVIMTGVIVSAYIIYINILYNVYWDKRIERAYRGRRYGEYAYVECYDTLNKTLTVRGSYKHIPILSSHNTTKNNKRYIIKAVQYDNCTEVVWLGFKYLTNKPRTLFFNIMLRDVVWLVISNYLFGIAFALLILYGITEGVKTAVLYSIIVLLITFPYEVVNKWRYEK